VFDGTAEHLKPSNQRFDFHRQRIKSRLNLPRDVLLFLFHSLEINYGQM